MNILINAVYPQGLGLSKFRINALLKEVQRCTLRTSVAKSTDGIGTPLTPKACRRQQLAGFFMRTICTHLYNSLVELYQNYGGLIEGASARRNLGSGSSNLGQSITSQRLEPLGDGFKNYPKEASIMLTTPTQAVTTAMIYTFLIAGGSRKLSELKRIRTISVSAQSEQLARKQLKGMRLTFMSRTHLSNKGAMA